MYAIKYRDFSVSSFTSGPLRLGSFDKCCLACFIQLPGRDTEQMVVFDSQQRDQHDRRF